MNQAMITIPLKVPCYLLSAGNGYVLIDCGDSSDRQRLDQQLAQAGVRPGNLALLLLTHGDFDHSGNAAYLQQKYAAKVAMHKLDEGMVTQANMGWNRKARPDRVTAFGRVIMLISPLFAGKNPFEKFTPDVFLEDGQDLSAYGLDARVLSLPGHSKGSIGVLTPGKASSEATGLTLFCGDLLSNMFGVGLPFMIDDLAAFSASIEKLRSLPIGMVYPGHGKPFPLERFLDHYRPEDLSLPSN